MGSVLKLISRTTFAAKNRIFLQTIDLIEVTITDSETGFKDKTVYCVFSIYLINNCNYSKSITKNSCHYFTVLILVTITK